MSKSLDKQVEELLRLGKEKKKIYHQLETPENRVPNPLFCWARMQTYENMVALISINFCSPVTAFSIL